MGLLDDAIREHLDLKRRRGADPAEIERAEREALGPVRREPILSEEQTFADVEPVVPAAHEPAGASDHPFDVEPGLDLVSEEPSAAPEEREGRRGLSFFGRRKRGHGDEERPDAARADEHPADEEPFIGAGELRGDRYGDRYEVEAYEDELYEDDAYEDELYEDEYEVGPPTAGGIRFHPPEELAEERPPPPSGAPSGDLPSGGSEIPTWGGPGDTPPSSGAGTPDESAAGEGERAVPHRATPPPATAGPPSDDMPLSPAPPPPAEEDLFGATVEYDVESGLDETGAVRRPRRSRGGPEPAQAASKPDDDDVLEETPEFLQDTPDHDRLWFEQKPPRDFDFDG